MSWEDTMSGSTGGLNSSRRDVPAHQRTSHFDRGEHDPREISKETLNYKEWEKWDKRLKEASNDFYSSQPNLVATSPPSSPQSSPKQYHDNQYSQRHKDSVAHRGLQRVSHRKHHQDGDHKHHRHKHHHRHHDHRRNEHHHGHRGHRHGHHADSYRVHSSNFVKEQLPRNEMTKILSCNRPSHALNDSRWSDEEEEWSDNNHLRDVAERKESRLTSSIPPKPSCTMPLDEEYGVPRSKPTGTRYPWQPGTLSLRLWLGTNAWRHDNPLNPLNQRKWFERSDSKKGKLVSNQPHQMEMVFFETISEETESEEGNKAGENEREEEDRSEPEDDDLSYHA